MDQSDPPKPARASEMIWTVMDGTGHVAGADFFAALVRHLASALDVPYAIRRGVHGRNQDPGPHAGVLESRRARRQRRVVDLAGTPCELVIAGGSVASHPDDFQTRFPEDRPLVAMGAQSYLGVPLLVGVRRDARTPRGLRHRADGASDEINGGVLRTFAARACMELRAPALQHTDRRAQPETPGALRTAPGRCSRSTTPSSST